MRQVFSSPRLDSIDQLEALLNAEGIQTHVSNRDILGRDRLRRFSYAKPAAESSWPALWIVHAEDLPRAREMLRAAGLMNSTRPDVASQYQLLPRPAAAAPSLAGSLRRALLVAVLIATTYFLFAMPRLPQREPPPQAAPTPSTAGTATTPPRPETVIVIDTENVPEAKHH